MAPSMKLFAGLFLLLAMYCGTDPLGHGPMLEFPGFQTYEVELPPAAGIQPARDANNLLQKAEVRFMNQVQGPESISFDPKGRGPYTGVADGRVLFWNGDSWSDFAYTSPNRSEICEPKPSLLSYLKNEHICGRPLGLRFHKRTGDLYIADAYFGLLKVGPEGGLATPLTTMAEGVPFNFTNDLDIDEEGNVYFTDSSTHFQRRNFLQLVFTSEPSGRLLKYNPATKETTVLLRNLQFPNGVSLSKDGSFLVFCEGSRARLLRYWLKGEKAGTSEVFAYLPGFPDNVRTNAMGEFWVGIHCRITVYARFMSRHPMLKKFFLKLPIKARYHHLLEIGGKLHGIIAKFSPDGKLLQVLEDSQGKVVKAVSQVEEHECRCADRRRRCRTLIVPELRCLGCLHIFSEFVRLNLRPEPAAPSTGSPKTLPPSIAPTNSNPNCCYRARDFSERLSMRSCASQLKMASIAEEGEKRNASAVFSEDDSITETALQ